MDIGDKQLLVDEKYPLEGTVVDTAHLYHTEVDVEVTCECGNKIGIYTTYSCWRCSKCGRVYWVTDPVVMLGNEIVSDGDPRIYTEEVHKKNIETMKKRLDEYFAEKSKSAI